MEIEKTGQATFYYVEDEKNSYYVTCYYDENGDWDNWEVFKNEEDSEVEDNELRKKIIDAVMDLK